MLGVSLSIPLLMENASSKKYDSMLLEHFGGRSGLLRAFGKLGVTSIELRSVRMTHTPESILEIAEAIWNEGLSITVHGSLKTRENAIDEVFKPLSLLLNNLRQKSLNITVHPVTDGCVEALTALSDYALEHNYPVVIALENCRSRFDGELSDSCPLVLDVIKQVNRPNVRICWDFGHYYYNVDRYMNGDKTSLPPSEFLKYTVHTHIHSYVGTMTHYPLGSGELPLEYYCNALAYSGIYNIELEPERFAHEYEVCEAYCSSIKLLRSKIPLRSVSVNDFYQNYGKYWNNAASVLNNSTGDTCILQKATGYIFSTSGVRWAMDLNLRYIWMDAGSKERIKKDCSTLDFIILTHEHGDHLDNKLIELLSDTDVKWVIPEFFNFDSLRKHGLREENLIKVSAGNVYNLKSICITPFKSLHFRAGTENGVLEYGYHVKLENGKTILFPADVRNYDASLLPDFGAVDYMFAHVWLGDSTALSLKCEPYLRLFAEFVTGQKPRTVILAHLYENGRLPKDMWTYTHAGLAADAIYRIAPEISVKIPKIGEEFTL